MMNTTDNRDEFLQQLDRAGVKLPTDVPVIDNRKGRRAYTKALVRANSKRYHHSRMLLMSKRKKNNRKHIKEDK